MNGPPDENLDATLFWNDEFQARENEAAAEAELQREAERELGESGC